MTALAWFIGMAKPTPQAPGARAAGEYRRVDADDGAFRVGERPAGIARVDGGVRLEILVKGAFLQIPLLAADDAYGYGIRQAERAADRQNPLADLRFVGIAESCRPEVRGRLDLQEGEVGFLVHAEQAGREFLAPVEFDQNLLGVPDDVVVRQDVPFFSRR